MYLTLPSDSSFMFYPENTISNFTIKLHKTYNFYGGDWKIGLARISIPLTAFNIKHRELIIEKKETVDNGEGQMDVYYRPYYIVKEGYYNKENMIADSFKMLPRKDLRISLTGYDQKVRIQMTNECQDTFRLNDALLQFLGGEFRPALEDGNKLNPKVSHAYRATRVLDINRSIHNYYIYIDIAQSRVVGDKFAPLLAVIPAPNYGKFSDTLEIRFDTVRFLKLSKNSFDNISVAIRDDHGQLIQFESGKVILDIIIQQE